MENWIQNHKSLWWVLSVVGLTAIIGTVELMLCEVCSPVVIAIEYIGTALCAILFNVVIFSHERFKENKFLSFLLCVIVLGAIIGTMRAAHSNFNNFAESFSSSAVIGFIFWFCLVIIPFRKNKE